MAKTGTGKGCRVRAPRSRFAFAVLAVVGSLLGSAACATRPGGGPQPRPFPGAALPPAPTEPITPADDVAPVGAPLLATALTLRGIPYRNGGSDVSGFDCSGFVQYVFAQHGMALPREVRDQFLVGREIDRHAVQAGDLIFFETVSSGASHVGIALDNGQFVHAPSSRGVVRVERYSSPYWDKRWVGARRIE